MGRDKVPIARRQTLASRQITFSKRKNGLSTKVTELSILCGIQLVVLAFSPSGKPHLILGKDSSLGDILDCYATESPQERMKRQKELLKVRSKSFFLGKILHSVLKSLNRTCMRQGHEINMELLSSEGQAKAQLYRNQINELQAEIDEVERQLSIWRNPEEIDNKEQLLAMEESLNKSLESARQKKLAGYIDSKKKGTSSEKSPAPAPHPTGKANVHPSYIVPHQELMGESNSMWQQQQTTCAPNPYANATYFGYPQEQVNYNPWGVGFNASPFGHDHASTSGGNGWMKLLLDPNI